MILYHNWSIASIDRCVRCYHMTITKTHSDVVAFDLTNFQTNIFSSFFLLVFERRFIQGSSFRYFLKVIQNLVSDVYFFLVAHLFSKIVLYQMLSQPRFVAYQWSLTFKITHFWILIPSIWPLSIPSNFPFFCFLRLHIKCEVKSVRW